MNEVRARRLALSPRERRMITVGAPLAVLLLLFIAWSASRRSAREASDVAVTAPTPAPLPIAAGPPAAAAPAIAILPSPPPNIMLFGVSGGGPAGRAAVLGGPTGAQRAVAVGRTYRDMTVKEVGLNFAVLSGRGGEVRLELDRNAASPVAN